MVCLNCQKLKEKLEILEEEFWDHKELSKSYENELEEEL